MSRLNREDLEAAVHKVKVALNELEGILASSKAKPRTTPSAVPARRVLCREILQAQQGLTIYEIITEMRKRGYAFSGQDPVNSLRPMLYRSPEFTRVNRRFYLKEQSLDGKGKKES